MLLTRSSGLSRSGNAPATTRTLGRSSPGPEPRGPKFCEYSGAARRLNGISAAPQLGFFILLHLPSILGYDDAKSQGVDCCWDSVTAQGSRAVDISGVGTDTEPDTLDTGTGPEPGQNLGPMMILG